jgi:hypothetical protein
MQRSAAYVVDGRINIAATCNLPASCSEFMIESADQTLSNKRRRKNMMMKHILAVALVAPFLTVSSMAQDAPRIDQHVYQGGPGSNIPHAIRQMTSAGEAFAMAPKARTSHAYRGGPGTVVVHGN